MLEPINYILHILYITVSLCPKQHQVYVKYVINPNVQSVIFHHITVQLHGVLKTRNVCYYLECGHQ